MKLTLGASRWAALRRPIIARQFWPTSIPYGLIEALLIVLLAVQAARLIWAAATPFGPIGNWTAGVPAPVATDVSLLARFDPFFRLAPAAGPAVVTSAPVKLFGVRLDQATGRGSAIIATADGVQASFAVGDEIMPGMILKAVMLDHVTIERGGVAEQLYLDQSVAASVATPGAPPPAGGVPPPTGGVPTVSALRAGIGFAPRVESGTITGFVVSPNGSGDIFRAVGFMPGDVVTTINGRGFRSVQEAAEALGALPQGSQVQFGIERGGTNTTITTRIGQ